LLVACNKSDLPCRLDPKELDHRLSHNGVRDSDASPSRQSARLQSGRGIVWTSALTGAGMDELRAKILEIAVPARDLAPEGEFITNLRHQQLIKESLQALAHALHAADEHLPHEMLLLDLYEALGPLDTITGATTVDDVLGIIFSSFCVGK
jgi:tRNA modification GTPase